MAIIRHETVLVNHEIRSAGNYAAVQVKLSPANYSGTCTWCIEATGTTGSGTTSFILKDLAGNTHATLDFTETSPTLKRAEFSTPPTADNYYAAVSGDGIIYNPKVVCLQDVGSSCSGSETQIEIGGYISTTSTIPVPLGEPKYFAYNSAEWDGTISAYFDVSGGIDSPGVATFYLEEDDGSWGNWEAITNVTLDSYGFVRGDDIFDSLTNGRHYRISIKTSDALYDAGNYLAKLVFVQSGTVTKMAETMTMLSNSDEVSNFGPVPTGLVKYLSADWTDSNVSFKYAQDAITSGDGSKLYNVTDSADVTSVIYGPNQQITTTITTPDSGDILTPNVTNWDSGINHCLLLAYVALSSAPSGGATVSVSANASGSGIKTASKGSGAAASVSASGVGVKTASGGSSASVSAVASGAGAKIGESGSGAIVTVTATGAGEPFDDTIKGGSSAAVTVTDSGAGTKIASGGSSASVSANAVGAGAAMRSGGSGAVVAVTASGGGRRGFQPVHMTFSIGRRRIAMAAEKRNCGIKAIERNRSARIVKRSISLEVIE
jgi:hypothetical protein